MKWFDLVNFFRVCRSEGLPIQIGVNSLILSPWIKDENDTGWRIRFFKKSFLSKFLQIKKISQELDLNVRIVENDSNKYLDVYKAGYNDPVHMQKYKINSLDHIETIIS